MTKNKSADLKNIPIEKQTWVLQKTNADEVFEKLKEERNWKETQRGEKLERNELSSPP